MILSYIPFSKGGELLPLTQQPKHGFGEGQYDSAETFKSRNEDQNQISEFLDKIFVSKNML